VTVVSDRRSSTGWRIVLEDGTQQGVGGQVLIGRQVKKADPRWPAARLLSVADGTKSVSKVHALVEADSSTFSVTDLGSTNGVIIVTADGTEIDLASGSRGEVPAGATIVLGNYVIKVEKD
jgi:pSer/pThr/pTyr-binding forkhead associated (FHA) protein